MDYSKQRELMVQNQIIQRGIKDRLVIAAVSRVPRHLFVEEALANWAYEDRPLPIGEKQTISQPYMVALMTEKLNLSGGDKVLEIGTGSGYQTAVLAEIAGEVYSIERVPAIAGRAQETLKELGYKNIHLKTGDGTLGWPEAAPFKAILVTAGSPNIPPPLLEQLDEGGYLVIPVGGESSQELHTIRKKKSEYIRTVSTPCVFVKLMGACGW